jgi:hypothetical protein
LAGDDDYLRGATSINHQVALRANFKMYSRSAKGGEKGDPNRNPWLAKMIYTNTTQNMSFLELFNRLKLKIESKFAYLHSVMSHGTPPRKTLQEYVGFL